jgi:hypothetical protein
VQTNSKSPGKPEAKNFINAVQETTDKSIQIMTDLKAIRQETTKGKSPQRTREQDSRDLRKASTEASSTEAKKANKNHKFRAKLVNTTGKTSLHPGKDRVGDLWNKNEQVRRFVTTNLTIGQECHNKVRAGRRQPGARAGTRGRSS